MRKFLLFLLLVSATSSFAQSIWSPVPEASINLVGERRIVPSKYQTMWLNLNALQSVLTAAPERFTPAAELQSALPILTLPNPEGRMTRFRLTESSVMEAPLQAQYPDIRCYTGYGIDDPTAFLKCDLTPMGFHAMVFSTEKGTYFVDPYSYGDRANYVVYYKKDYPLPAGKTFVCETEPGKLKEMVDPLQTPDAGSCQLRRYRLALACTVEYAAYQGGTVAAAAAAMTTSVNRVNGVYETEIAVTMVLVANNSSLIYITAPDPYTNGNGSTMLGQNVSNCNSVIGTANYDIGHVFSTGGGGVANLGCVCTNAKARGVTGSVAPSGDPFDIDYVAHEMGHQFGAGHTFNGTNGSCGGGNVDQGTAFEPGSGSTIMAYAGICTGQNVQNNSDAYFHAGSLQEIGIFTTLGSGNNCGTILSSNNNAPTANAGLDYSIPKSTPFILTASGNDINGNSLTYNWEQRNAEPSTQPPAAISSAGPNFRSFTATSSPTRYFPILDAIINNATPTYEVLPSVSRTLNFRVTVRDIGAAYGCTGEDDMIVTVAASGPFQVTAPNVAGIIWTVAGQTITWNVNGTTAAPVSCANVNILLSTDGGYTFPTTLASNTPNDGSEFITIPNTVLGATSCRVKIEGVGNIFFDMSNNNFAIAAVLPVELTDFQARLENKNTALLTWTTASETNNRGFDIEMKQEDDKDFQNVGFVAGKGTSTQKNNYQFRIPNLAEGTWYFRLKQQDMDGKTTYSAQQSLQVRDRFSVKIFPNPVQNDLNLVLFQEDASAVSFELTNQLGQRFDLLTSESLEKGFSNLNLSVSSLPNGVYYYVCRSENGLLQGKLVVNKQ